MLIDSLPADIAPPGFNEAHKHLLADKTIQFSFPIIPKPVEPPTWLFALGRFFGNILSALGPFGFYIFWGLLALLLGFILLLILQQLGYINWRRNRTGVAIDEDAPFWDDAPARRLLQEADSLATQGRYEEAAHLLLLRSFEDIQHRRPYLLKPASTARDMARSEGLPTAARETFGTIAHHVEASLFGGARLDEGRWALCRAAYATFIHPKGWIG